MGSGTSALRRLTRMPNGQRDSSRPSITQRGQSNRLSTRQSTSAKDCVADQVPVVPLPPELEELKNFISDTPTGDDANIYKYYCPLCMNHYQGILKTSCCGNYLCYQCGKDYLATKKQEVLGITDIVGNKLSSISCPNCSTVGLSICIVNHSEIVRDYSWTGLESATSPKFSSPIKIGDTFDDLKRKMVLYQKSHHEDRTECASPQIGCSSDMVDAVDRFHDLLIPLAEQESSVAESNSVGPQEENIPLRSDPLFNDSFAHSRSRTLTEASYHEGNDGEMAGSLGSSIALEISNSFVDSLIREYTSVRQDSLRE